MIHKIFYNHIKINQINKIFIIILHKINLNMKNNN